MPVTVHLKGKDAPMQVDLGVRVRDILPSHSPSGCPYVAALVNNEIVSLQMPIVMNCTIEGMTIERISGWQVFCRTMCFLLAMAASRALPDRYLRIGHTLGWGVFASIRDSLKGAERPILPEEICKIEEALRALVAEDLPISEQACGYEEAVATFAAAGQHDKVGLLRHVNKPIVLLQCCGEFRGLHQGPMLARTGMLEPFAFIPYGTGFVIQGPSKDNPHEVAAFEEEPALVKIHQEHSRWGDILGIHSVGDLNQAIEERRISDIMEMAEALHDKKLSDIADQIANRTPRPRFVLIAGPSSAGKTTTCKRLAVHLRVVGLKPLLLSTDDYFVEESKDPIGPDGKPDYEHIRAVDIDALKADLAALLEGKSVRRRIFDFREKRPTWTDEMLQLGPNDIICMEGIHGLNPLLTDTIPREQKFLIYLSAITQLGIDDSNILSTSDNRLVRRLVRDHFFRDYPAKKTLSLWPSVRRGEERWIFPFQNEADVAFNTSLDYELSVLRPYAEALLTEIKPADPEYALARRLHGVLRNFHPIPSTAVPGDSILREYIGGSSLKY